MGTKFVFILSFFLIVISSASAYSTWLKTYDGPGYVYISFVEPLDNGHILFSAFSDSVTGYGETWVGEVDENGILLWDKFFPKAPKGLAEIPGEGYLVLTGFGPGQMIRLDQSGNQVWSFPVSYPARGLQLTSDGHYVYCSSDSLRKMDSNGTEIWAVEVPAIFAWVGFVGSAASSPGGFTITGSKYTGGGTQNIALSGVVDTAGQLIWYGEFTEYSLPLTSTGRSFTDLEGNCYSCLGFSSGYPPPVSADYVLRYDAGGVLDWYIEFDDADAICPSPEYDPVITGSLGEYSSQQYFLRCVNRENGSSYWNVTHDMAVSPYCISRAPQGGYILGGGYSSHGVIVRTDSLGLYDGMGIEESTSDTFLASPYPNPASSSVTISLQAPSTSPASIMIADIAGRTVTVLDDPCQYQSLENLRTVHWDLTGYGGAEVPAGLYTIVVTTGSNVMTERVVVIR